MSAEFSPAVTTLLTTNTNLNLQLIWLTEDILHRLYQISLFTKRQSNQQLQHFSQKTSTVQHLKVTLKQTFIPPIQK